MMTKLVMRLIKRVKRDFDLSPPYTERFADAGAESAIVGSGCRELLFLTPKETPDVIRITAAEAATHLLTWVFFPVHGARLGGRECIQDRQQIARKKGARVIYVVCGFFHTGRGVGGGKRARVILTGGFRLDALTKMTQNTGTFN